MRRDRRPQLKYFAWPVGEREFRAPPTDIESLGNRQRARRKRSPKEASMADTKSKLHVAPDPEPAAEGEELSIAKPSAFDLNKFVSKRSAAVASVETTTNGTAAPQHCSSQ